MKTVQFSGWVTSRIPKGLIGKTTQFSGRDRDMHWVSVQSVYAISSVNRMGKVSNLCVIFEGIQSQGGCRVRHFRWPTWRLNELLASSATWKDLLGASALFPVTVDRVDNRLMVWLSEGSLVIRTSTKWLSVWMSEKCKCDLTNKHPRDLTTRWLKPTRQTCSTWLTDGGRNKRVTCDLSLIDRDDVCVIVNVTPCASATYVFIVNITCTHEAKILSMIRTWSQIRN